MRELALRLLSIALGCVVAIVAVLAMATLGVAQEQPEPSVVPSIPPEERDRPNPVPANEESIEYGKLVYSSQCTMCHGKQGAGDGDLVPRLKLTMPDFTASDKVKARTDGELFYILTQGHGRMPGQGERWNEKARWDLVNYTRSLRK